MTEDAPELSAVVVHWHDEDHLRELLDAWPDDPRCELLVVDNSSSLDELPRHRRGRARLLDPGRNLGFAGGVNHGVRNARGRWVLILNADVRPEEGAVERLVDGLEELRSSSSAPQGPPAGLVPALVGDDGRAQTRWQLRPLPSLVQLLVQTCFLSVVRGPKDEPERGTPIPQPAGAALAVERAVLERLGGLDEGYFPAWFEDVDLARRLADAGHRLLYEPRARFRHAIGASVPALGYGPFLWIYYRNLTRYLALHHGRGWALLARIALPLGTTLRLALLPLRRPRRATSRVEAAAGLVAVLTGAVSDWRIPLHYAVLFTRRPEPRP